MPFGVGHRLKGHILHNTPLSKNSVQKKLINNCWASQFKWTIKQQLHNPAIGGVKVSSQIAHINNDSDYHKIKLGQLTGILLGKLHLSI